MIAGADTVSICATPTAVANAAADHMAGIIRAQVAAQGHCTLALAGGTTPAGVYMRLAASPYRESLPWAQIDFYWGDERCVPPEARESNFGLAWRLLLSALPLAPAHIHRIRGELPDAEEAARLYAALLPPHLDLLMLGVGPDGHTASLFPGSSALEASQSRAVVVDAPKPPPRRVTITPPVIAAANARLVIATGSDKAAVIAQALTGPWAPATTPVQWARPAHWILDAAAAMCLERDAPGDEE
jgi:6-phosphogluconolactonase